MSEQIAADDRVLAETCQDRCRSEFMGDEKWGGIPDDQRLAFKACADQCIGSGRARADKAAEDSTAGRFLRSLGKVRRGNP